ncbi:hypothetical protein DFH06DRAFT_355631 [Mycena polygramma]|nr:hypothetical protein DFH06DRAFT_355631 [Mycena polygramma]
MQSAFEVQELVDYILFFLRDSRSDVKTCALVCHSWAYPAQSHLFREITVFVLPDSEDNLNRWPQVLAESPHLICHIRGLRLVLSMDQSNAPGVSDICNFPFTHLQWVRCSYAGRLSGRDALVLKQLFSLPTLRHVMLATNIGNSENLAEIFRCCPQAMQHLDLSVPGAPPDQHTSGSRASIALTSLIIRRLGYASPDDDLHTVLQPFTALTLRALSITGAPTVQWSSLPLEMNNFEILGIDVESNHIGLDLSAFPQLSLLRIRLTTSLDLTDLERRARSLVSSITRVPPHLRTIVLAMYFLKPERHRVVRTVFDQAFATRPGLTVQVELPPDQINQAATHFPELSAKNMLRSAPYRSNWWEETVLRL